MNTSYSFAIAAINTTFMLALFAFLYAYLRGPGGHRP